MYYNTLSYFIVLYYNAIYLKKYIFVYKCPLYVVNKYIFYDCIVLKLLSFCIMMFYQNASVILAHRPFYK